MEGLTDLHRHLDGSLRLETLRELAGHVPADFAFTVGMGLDAALSRFAFTLSVLQTPAAVRRVAAEICEDAIAEGVTTLEIRFAPQLHRGGNIPEIVAAARAGIDGRAKLILCGLYGEDPALVEALARQDCDAIDLAGGPLPSHRWRLGDYSGAFRFARSRGLGRTVHAGEGRPPSEIREAIELLGAQRIGHATTLLDDASAVDLVVREGITIEACPTSNLHTGAITGEHPFREWLRLGVRVCVNTDNTLLSDTTAPEELRRLGLSEAERAAVLAHGRVAAW